MTSRFITLFCALLVVTACGKKDPPANPETAPETRREPRPELPLPPERIAPQRVGPGAPLYAGVVPLPEPHRYRVELRWHDASVHAERWVLQREDSQYTQERVGVFGEDVRRFDDVTVKDGERYRYSLFQTKGQEQTLVANVNVSIPKDRVIDTEMGAENITEIARLFFTERAKIRGGNAEIRINVDELHSRGGVIESFNGETAPAGQEGRSAGSITVRARIASGRLLIRSRGEHGGAGLQGAPGAVGANGAKGSPGDTSSARGEHYCRQNGPGEPGMPGARGGAGGNGGKGGNSGAALVDIREVSPLQVEFDNAPGNGGAAGAGGPGGNGGSGGEPGDMHRTSSRCPKNETWGAPGASGESGPPGYSGAAGSQAPVCLRIAASASGNCQNFPK